MITALHDLSSDLHNQSYKACSRKIVEAEWFEVSSSVTANYIDVQGYIAHLERESADLLHYVVNLQDTNVNIHNLHIIIIPFLSFV
jgi:hypothetical protein